MTGRTWRLASRPLVARVGGLIALLAAAGVWAHEGHQALPTRGASFDADKGVVNLAPEASKALDVQTADVVRRALAEQFTAPATVVPPWGRHAYASTPLGGKVAALRVQPGEAVGRGQV